MNVADAAKVFSSSLRMHLIRFYLSTAGTQHDAVEALGVPQRSVSRNTIALVAAGVLLEQPSDDKRQQTYCVDVARVEELLAAAGDFSLNRS